MRLATDRPVDLGLAVAALLLVDLLALAGVEGWPRIGLGLVAVLFAPGYALVSALFPERHRATDVQVGEPGDATAVRTERGIDGLERVALSLGLSIAVVPLLGLALNFTPWGIRLLPILVTLTLFTAIASGVAAWRRRQLPPEERFRIEAEVSPPEWRSYSGVDKALTIALAISVVAAGGALAYVLSKPRVGETFTEFYILGPGGRAEDYPTNLTVGEEGRLILGIVNHEGEPVEYAARMVAQRGAFADQDGNRTFVAASNETLQTWNPTLADEETWLENVTLSLDEPGEYRVQFELYRGAPAPSDEPYRRLHLFVTVNR